MKIRHTMMRCAQVFWGVVFVSLLFVSVSHAQPKIFFEEVTFDAGDVEQGTDAEHVFTFVNQGMDELVIQKVSTS